MSHSRIHIDTALRPETTIEVNGDRAHYLGKVLRLRAGDSVSVFNGDDGEFAATLGKLSKNGVTIELGPALAVASESALKIHLVQCVSRGERMDFVVQKATELGVKRITPVLSEYGVVKLTPDRAGKRREHWQKVAISACEQSGRVRPPLVESPLPLKSWFGQRTGAADTDLVLRPGATTRLVSLDKPSTKVCLLIGPEGGFSAGEYDDAKVAGFTAVSLGPRILRTETAAVVAVSVAQAIWGDF